MNITDVKVFPVREAKLKAYVSIVLDQSFMVNDLKIIQGRDGLFISMPSRRRRNGTYRDIAHPLNSDTRQVLQDRVLAAYRAVAVEGSETAVANGGPEEDGGAAHASLAAATAEGEREPMPAASSSPLAPTGEAAPEPSAPPPSTAAPAGQGDAVAAPAPAQDDTDDPDRSLLEVEEEHLSDSFWTMS